MGTNMNRAKGILGIVLVFACGMAVGAVIMHVVNQRMLAEVAARGPEGLQQVVARHLDRELSLDKAQRKQLATILEAHQQRIMQIMRPHHAAFRESFEKTADRIREILTPEQQKRFAELEAKRKEQLRKPFFEQEQNEGAGAGNGAGEGGL